MGLLATSLSDALFTQSQQKVLGLLFGHVDRQFHVNEMLRLTGAGKGALQRELARLESAGLVRMEKLGNQKRYQANRDAPIFEELRGIVLKTFGLVERLREALAPLAEAIDEAFVFGSVATGTDTAGSDIDLMVIGKSDMIQVLDALAGAEKDLGRPVHLTLYSPTEWRKLKKSDAVVRKILDNTKMKVLPDATPR